MDVVIRLPQALAVDADGASELLVDLAPGATLGDVLVELGTRYPALIRRLCDETGTVRRFVNVYVGDDESRRLEGLATPITGGTTILVAGSVAGG